MPQTTGKRLVEALRKQLERIEYFSSVENVSPNLAVHELRKTFKRLRALLVFYANLPDDFSPEIQTNLKHFGRTFSEMRESFVNLQVFERITSGDVLVPERKIKACREKLTEKNKELIDKGFFEKEEHLLVQNFGKNLESQLENLSHLHPSSIHIVKQLEKTYFDAFEINSQLWTGSDPHFIHELRKKLKRLMYQFEFVRYMQPRFFKSKTFQLNTITEQLGEDHDLFIFLEETKKEEYEFDSEELTIIENKIQHLREINHIKLFPRLKKFFGEAPEVFNSRLETIFKVS